jgi:tetratricopeptide (TPR) repeat protein
MFGFGLVQAQTNGMDSILSKANELLAQGQYEQATKILKPHIDNVHAVRLLAVSYYWNNKPKEARLIYQYAILKHPNSYVIKLEFGRMLYESKQFDEAQSTLTKVLTLHPENVEANKYLGFLNFYKGNYAASVMHFEAVLRSFPENTEALEMLEKIEGIRAIRLGIGNTVSSDNQPLNSLKSTLSLSKIKSNYWQPQFEFSNYLFDSDTISLNAQSLVVGNRFNFPKAKVKVNLKGGYYFGHLKGSDQYLADLSFSKALPRHFSISGQWKAEPTMYALSSLGELVGTNTLKLQADLKNDHGLLGQIAWQKALYFDENEEQRMHLWLVSPPMKYKKLKVRLGLATSLADAKSNMFESAESLENVLLFFNDNEQISGVYNPYFTPTNQNIYSVVGLFEFDINKIIEIKISTDYGFIASADIPYIYLENGLNGIELQREFYREKTSTLDVKADVLLHFSERFTMSHRVGYLKNFFYKSGVYDFKLNWLL